MLLLAEEEIVVFPLPINIMFESKLIVPLMLNVPSDNQTIPPVEDKSLIA